MSNINNKIRPKVKLISHTPYPIDLIAKCAAACYDSEPKTSTVIHCVRSGHTSVLEHANFTFQIENVSRSLLAQLTRHRVGVAFSVISQRYVSMEDTPFVIPRAMKSTTATVNAISIIQNTFDNIRNDYLELLDAGVSKGNARCILPNACSCKIMMTINLRALCHLCNERLCSKAQLEIREMVQDMKDCILNLEDIPNDFKQFMKDKMLVPKCCAYAVEHCSELKEGCGLRPPAKEINQYIKERTESQLSLIHKKYKDIHRLKTTYANDFSIGNHIIIQEKIDGANACIRYDSESNQIIAQSRNCILSDGNTLRGFYTWAKSLNPKQFSILGDRFLIFGEWLVPHSVKYPNEDYNKFYVFDVYDTEKEEYLPQANAHDFANALNLLYVPTFYDGKFTSWDDILGYVGRTEMGGEYGEGIVIKNQTTLNSPKLEFYVKIVGEKFQETKGSNAKTVDKEKLHSLEVDMNLAQTIVTTARVTKILNKLVDESILPEDWGLESMGIVAKNLCKRIVEDCIKEEPETVSKINNFGKIANKIAMQYAKEIAMTR